MVLHAHCCGVTQKWERTERLEGGKVTPFVVSRVLSDVLSLCAVHFRLAHVPGTREFFSFPPSFGQHMRLPTLVLHTKGIKGAAEQLPFELLLHC